MEPNDNETIWQFAGRLVRTAKSTNADVRGVFEGVELVATPNTLGGTLVREYNRARAASQAGWTAQLKVDTCMINLKDMETNHGLTMCIGFLKEYGPLTTVAGVDAHTDEVLATFLGWGYEIEMADSGTSSLERAQRLENRQEAGRDVIAFVLGDLSFGGFHPTSKFLIDEWLKKYGRV